MPFSSLGSPNITCGWAMRGKGTRAFGKNTHSTSKCSSNIFFYSVLIFNLNIIKKKNPNNYFCIDINLFPNYSFLNAAYLFPCYVFHSAASNFWMSNSHFKLSLHYRNEDTETRFSSFIPVITEYNTGCRPVNIRNSTAA